MLDFMGLIQLNSSSTDEQLVSVYRSNFIPGIIDQYIILRPVMQGSKVTTKAVEFVH
jgi:hypothetical protein